MDIKELLLLTVRDNASDLHLIAGIPPVVRVDGGLRQLTSYPPLTSQNIEQMIFSLLTPEQKELLVANKEIDFSFGLSLGTQGGNGRFRSNSYYQRGVLSAAFRYLPPTIMTLEDLHLPAVCHGFTDLRQGFVLVVGPTGQGKSTTLAAIINEINTKKATHILTIEDPIEYVYPTGRSIISQREIGSDTFSWATALKSALREDPDVVLIGEMRDPETMQAAITIAETGHLVFSTLHTNSAAQSIDRIVDSFPTHQREQIRMQFASSLRGIVSQRLLPRIGGGRIPAVEVLLGTPAVANNIRDGKTHLIDSVIQTSRDMGMVTLESSLKTLVEEGLVTLEDTKGFLANQDITQKTSV